MTFQEYKKNIKDPVILAIDFDDTIHDKSHPIPGRKMGAPVEGAQAALMFFKSKGYKIIIYSVTTPQMISNFMNYYKLPFDSITNIKPNATYYIDNKAVYFDNWKDTVNIIMN